MPEAALTADSFNLVALFLHADWVGKLVMIVLAVASLWSWAIIFDKAVRLNGLNRAADRFEDQVGSGKSLEEVANASGDNPKHPLPKMLQAALREWKGSKNVSDTQLGLLIQRIDRALDSVIGKEMRKIEDGLSTLAIVATSSPFIGLFGTVWGIMTAFQAIALQKNTNLTVVAPAIAQALFATAIGLIAAIPAYIAYNRFTADAAKFSGRLEAFADDLSAAVLRRLGERSTSREA
jgi:biopolymer transport protein TolQ